MSLATNATSRLIKTLTHHLPPHDPILRKPSSSSSFLSQCNNLVLSFLRSSKTTAQVSQVHAFMVKTGISSDPFLSSKLLAASSVRGDTRYAAAIFESVPSPNLFMFNTMIRGFSIGEEPRRAFGVFNDLRGVGVELDQFSFVGVLKACASELAVGVGEMVHGVALRSGFLLFVNVKNSLLNVYCVCGRIGDARKVFDEMPEWNDVVGWNTLMGGYVRASQPGLCVELFKELVRRGLEVGESTLLCILSALCQLGGLSSPAGEVVHGYSVKVGLCSSSNLKVLTALIELYAKMGRIEEGRRIFNAVVDRKDVIVWNCMIDKYAKARMLEEAVALLKLMKVERVKPNSSTLVGLLSACAASGSSKLGIFVYELVKDEGLEMDAALGTALLNMFAKWGCLDKAVDVFERIKSKDVISWTAMILSYGFHGQSRNAVSLLDRMEKEGFRPNKVTFLAVLSACSHGGLVPEAIDCFNKMVWVYRLTPDIEHYTCIIDLLGRAGLLEDAYNLIKSLHIKSDAATWRALLSACRLYGNVELAKQVRRELGEIENEHPADSLLLSGTYSIAGGFPDEIRWQEQEKTSANVGSRTVPEKEKVVKEAGRSTVEVDSHWIKNFLK